MKIEKVDIKKVKPWEKNPRNAKIEDIERLKKQIEQLGVYKPLVATKEKDLYITLGGNMRLAVLKEMGFKEVKISVVNAPTDDLKLAYSLSDNDNVGFTVKEKLAEMLLENKDNFDFDLYKVNNLPGQSLNKIMDEFCDWSDGDLDNEDDLVDELDKRLEGDPEKKKMKCPKCGFEW